MDSKICIKCNEDKQINEFAFRGNGKRHNTCKICKRNYNLNYYKENKSDYIEKAKFHNKKNRIINREKLAKIKDQPCADCKQVYPHYVMDFDHVNGQKEDNVSSMVHLHDWEKIEKEVAKCEVVCANCHRQRTWERQQRFIAR